MTDSTTLTTRVLPVDARKLGTITAIPRPEDILDELSISFSTESEDARHIKTAAEKLRSSDVPLAFPTETVYGLGADATRSSAVRGIYHAKQRPADNPLIVHFSSLEQVRSLLRSSHSTSDDPIPAIYRPLIAKFWPGPLTILLPNPTNSPLAPEVTAGLPTFGARIPRHPLALALIGEAGVPVAAPSANASTKPSPTAAEHVAYDLDGRIEIILDGGPCDVGVESTVVDGLSNPPVVLRPGGISIEQIRSCRGWEDTQIGYKNTSELGSQPRAPGMKYRHYSPKATVVLYEAGVQPPTSDDVALKGHVSRKIGIISTKRWHLNESADFELRPVHEEKVSKDDTREQRPGFAGLVDSLETTPSLRSKLQVHQLQQDGTDINLLEIPLGAETSGIARGIFSALRELDRENVDVIFVEGIDDFEGELAAAVMNRLRKAAEVNVTNSNGSTNRIIA